MESLSVLGFSSTFRSVSDIARIVSNVEAVSKMFGSPSEGVKNDGNDGVVDIPTFLSIKETRI